jgi:hypothetical protein
MICQQFLKSSAPVAEEDRKKTTRRYHSGKLLCDQPAENRAIRKQRAGLHRHATSKKTSLKPHEITTSEVMDLGAHQRF